MADRAASAPRPGLRVWIGHPSGNQFFRHLVAALAREGELGEAMTCVDWNPEGLLARLIPAAAAGELARRDFSRSLGVAVARHPWREAARLAAGRLRWDWLARHEAGFCSVDAVYRDFDLWVAKRISRAAGTGLAYAYEDAAEATFRAAVERGWRRVYDLPIAHWETSLRLHREEAERWPAWRCTLTGTRDSGAKLERKTRELSAADVVVCPSRFVASSLPVRPGVRVVVAPFGSPPAGPPRPARNAGGPLRVLFAGSMGQRKGLADLFAAVRLLGRPDVELVVLGSPIADPAFYRRELPAFIHERTRSHDAFLAVMRSCDILCLPSIVEGRALVVQEALSQGLPVIVTPNTGADDAVEEGRSGFVVPIRRPEAIAEKIAWFADHRGLLADMSGLAKAAAARFSWEAYGAAILAALRPDPP